MFKILNIQLFYVRLKPSEYSWDKVVGEYAKIFCEDME